MAATVMAWSTIDPDGNMTAIAQNPKYFDPVIHGKSDPCVIYCVQMHEYVHFRDTRTVNVNCTSNQFDIFTEFPAYLTEKACLSTFLGQ